MRELGTTGEFSALNEEEEEDDDDLELWAWILIGIGSAIVGTMVTLLCAGCLYLM